MSSSSNNNNIRLAVLSGGFATAGGVLGKYGMDVTVEDSPAGQVPAAGGDDRQQHPGLHHVRQVAGCLGLVPALHDRELQRQLLLLGNPAAAGAVAIGHVRPSRDDDVFACCCTRRLVVLLLLGQRTATGTVTATRRKYGKYLRDKQRDEVQKIEHENHVDEHEGLVELFVDHYYY
uniref:Uncharacterized protein n=1 Tax=Trichogramma kaykai TaxID=54128 RepID=A0ABD2VZZ8_9HYME